MKSSQGDDLFVRQAYGCFCKTRDCADDSNKLHTSPVRRHGEYFGVEGTVDQTEVTTRYRRA
jgi:hypothetical protein